MTDRAADERRRTVLWEDPTGSAEAGRGIHVGGCLATAEARLTDASGKLYAHAVGTCLVFTVR